MPASEVNHLLERQLLLQLGDRLKRLRNAQGVTTTEMAQRIGVARNTLRAVESGDPSPSIGTYLRLMSALGIGAELALLAGDTMQHGAAGSAGGRSRRSAPMVRVHVSIDDS